MYGLSTNTNLLKATIILNGDNTTELARYLGIGRQALSRKIHNHVDFKQTEIAAIAQRYNMNSEDVQRTFLYVI